MLLLDAAAAGRGVGAASKISLSEAKANQTKAPELR
jgi:hypothetical protein